VSGLYVTRLADGDTMLCCAICNKTVADHVSGPMVDLKITGADNSVSVDLKISVHADCLRKKLP